MQTRALKWQSTYLDIGTVSGHYCWLHTPRHGNSVIMALSDRGRNIPMLKKPILFRNQDRTPEFWNSYFLTEPKAMFGRV